MEEKATKKAAVAAWVGTKSQLKEVTDVAFSQIPEELSQWKEELEAETERIENRSYLSLQEKRKTVDELQARFESKAELRFRAEDKRNGHLLLEISGAVGRRVRM